MSQVTGQTLLQQVLDNLGLVKGDDISNIFFDLYASRIQSVLDDSTNPDPDFAIALILMNSSPVRQAPAVNGVPDNLAGQVETAKDQIETGTPGVPSYSLEDALAIHNDPAQSLPAEYTITDEVHSVTDVTVAAAKAAYTAVSAILEGATAPKPALLEVFTWTLADTLANLEAVYGEAVYINRKAHTLTNEPGNLGTVSETARFIIDDATNAADYTFAVAASFTLTAPQMVNEGESITFTITASNELAEPKTFLISVQGYDFDGNVDPATVGGPASDFGAIPASVTIPAGATTATFSIPVLADGIQENTEGFRVTLLDSTGASIASATALIIDSTAEGGPMYTLENALALPALPEAYRINPDAPYDLGVVKVGETYPEALAILQGATNAASLSADLLTWAIADTAENILDADVSGADAVSITDATITVAQAQALKALANFDGVHAIEDTAANILAADVSTATSLSITDGTSTVAEAVALAALANFDGVYAIEDTRDNLYNQPAAKVAIIAAATEITVTTPVSVADLASFNTVYAGKVTGYSLRDTAANLSAEANAGVVAGAVSVEVAGAVSVEEYNTLKDLIGDFTYTLADTADNLFANEAIRDGAVSYALTNDPEVPFGKLFTPAQVAILEVATNAGDYTWATLSFAPVAETVAEGQRLTFNLTLSEPVTEAVTVVFQLRVGDDSAPSPIPDSGSGYANMNDFEQGSFTPRSVTIAAGQTEASFSVLPIRDNISELPELFFVDAKVNGGVWSLSADATIRDSGTSGEEGKTITLTTDVDNRSGTEGNDTFIGENSPAQTINPADFIDGKGGVNQALMFLRGADSTPVSLNAVNVQNWFVQGQGTVNQTFNFANVVGAEQIWSRNTDLSSTGVLKFDNIQNLVTLGVQGGRLTGDRDNITANFKSGVVATSETLDVAMVGGQVNTLRVGTDNSSDAFGAIAFDLTGSNYINTLHDGSATTPGVQPATTKLEFTGAGSLTIAERLQKVTTFDASDNTGGVNVKVATDKNITFTGGEGNDTVDVGNSGLTASDKLQGGGGVDTLKIQNGAMMTQANASGIEGFEILHVGGGQQTYNIDNIIAKNALTGVYVDVGAAGQTTTVNNINAAATGDIRLYNGNDGKVTLTAKNFISGGTSDTATMTLGSVTIDTLRFDQVNILNLKAEGATHDHVIKTLNAGDLQKVTITGAVNSLNVTTTADTRPAEVDASGLTVGSDGGVFWNQGIQNAGGGLKFTGTAGDDWVRGTGANTTTGDTIFVGAGSDTVIVQSNARDSLHFTASSLNSGDMLAGDSNTVYGFQGTGTVENGAVATDDIITFSSGALSQVRVEGQALSAMQANQRLGDEFSNTTNIRAVDNGTDVHLQIDMNGNGRFDADFDFEIVLRGHTGNDVVFDAEANAFFVMGTPSGVTAPTAPDTDPGTDPTPDPNVITVSIDATTTAAQGFFYTEADPRDADVDRGTNDNVAYVVTGNSGFGGLLTILNFTAGDRVSLEGVTGTFVDFSVVADDAADPADNSLTVVLEGDDGGMPVWTLIFEGVAQDVMDAVGSLDGQAAIDAIGTVWATDWIAF